MRDPTFPLPTILIMTRIICSTTELVVPRSSAGVIISSQSSMVPTKLVGSIIYCFYLQHAARQHHECCCTLHPENNVQDI